MRHRPGTFLTMFAELLMGPLSGAPSGAGLSFPLTSAGKACGFERALGGRDRRDVRPVPRLLDCHGSAAILRVECNGFASMYITTDILARREGLVMPWPEPPNWL